MKDQRYERSEKLLKLAAVLLYRVCCLERSLGCKEIAMVARSNEKVDLYLTCSQGFISQALGNGKVVSVSSILLHLGADLDLPTSEG